MINQSVERTRHSHVAGSDTAPRQLEDFLPYRLNVCAELVSLGCKFTAPVVVPAEGGVEVEVAGAAKEPVDGLTTVSLTVTCGGQKVLGMPKAVVRAG